MATQMNVNDYAKAIQWQLSDIISPIPVYANFNRNFATQNNFVTWQLDRKITRLNSSHT